MSDFNPFALLKPAATGDLVAQRQLADAAFSMARSCDQDFDPMAFMQDGLVFARLAAAQGNDGDKGRLIGMLALASELCGDERQHEYTGEALAVAELMAEGGNDYTADAIPALAETASPEAMQMAKFYRERMMGA